MNRYVIKVNNYFHRTEAPFIEDSRLGFVVRELIKNGFVFGEFRFTNLEDIATKYNTWWKWNDIVIGDDAECKRVLHAGYYYRFAPQRKTPRVISLNKFLRIKKYED